MALARGPHVAACSPISIHHHAVLTSSLTHTNPCRNWIGYDADKERPLKDPEHPFNTVYSAAFRLVCSGDRGRLLNTQS